MLGFIYKNIYYFNKNNRLINERSFTDYDHFNKVFRTKLKLNNNLKIKFRKIESLKNRYWKSI